MRLERTHDMALVRQIVTHPAIWPHVHEDATPDDWAPTDHEGFMWMLVTDEKPLGVFLLHARGVACLEMHTCLLPETWGHRAAEAAQLLAGWVFHETDCRKLITAVPAYNRAALRYAIAGGMQKEGVNRRSYLHGGEMVDQYMLGITKEEWLCQQRSQLPPR